jgi:hypothetical protein
VRAEHLGLYYRSAEAGRACHASLMKALLAEHNWDWTAALAVQQRFIIGAHGLYGDDRGA